MYAYPKPGTVNSAVRVGIVDVRSAKTMWVATDGDLRQHYVPWIAWADAGSLLLQHMNRLQNRNDLLVADAATGLTRRVFRDESRRVGRYGRARRAHQRAAASTPG